ncbi:biotin-dependent carboxyltransferase family protein [Phaeodactylibacter xiamenensis]|uniref:5-oxoprolinase subunit C family protein n=1 Tax=Phaeodactylibacter xiamenensis TaxID=1524460 RepID=UPI0024A80979|nr:biotin-dependent carboxyltransferase family protein [Phaeodactylibacter xiamenensis]
MLKVEIISTGLFDTLQDEGRPGYQSQGVPLGGAMDRQSAALANQLVGNPLGTPVVESTLLGSKLYFHGPAQIALTGALARSTLNGHPMPRYTTVNVSPEAILNIGSMQQGCRTYLAIRGDWQVQKWLGSCSPPPYQSEVLTPDSQLQPGQLLKIQNAPNIEIRQFPPQDQPIFPKNGEVRVFPGPEWGAFSDSARAQFLDQPFTLSKDSNRMGLRLKEQLPETGHLPGLLSSAVLPGTVQVPPSGQPIILMADAQTTGGYLRIAQVATNDLPILAQCRPGDQVQFRLHV